MIKSVFLMIYLSTNAGWQITGPYTQAQCEILKEAVHKAKEESRWGLVLPSVIKCQDAGDK
jgi:hypothetical protein